MPHRLASLCRACAQLVLFTALVAGVVDPAQGQSSQNINAQVNALLGAYENLASPARWRSLGDAAVPILESVVADYTALPTRRARAIDGLAALSSGSATMQRVANSDWEPLVVRISAVNGLAQVLPESDLIPALRPLLNDPQSQMRGITAKALSNTPAGCAEIAAMAQLETPAWRARYVRTCGGNTNSADQPPVGGGKTLVDKFMFTQIVDIFDPTGTKIYDIFNPPPNINQFDQPIIGGFSLLLPNSPTLAFPSGSWSFDTFVAGFHPDTMDVQALIKTGPTPTLTSGKLNANLFFLTSALGLDAKTAQSDPNFQAILSKVRSIYAQIGLELGDLTYIDITGDDLVRFEILEPNDEPSLFMLSNHPKARDGAINIFLVFTIDENGIVGDSGGIPGSPIRGTPASGVVVAMADFVGFPNPLDGIAGTIAHETGHWLGLFHTTEIDGLSFDPLPDTPQCPQVPYDTNNDGTMEVGECINLDATNLMFWTSDPYVLPFGQQTKLTPNQQFVVLRNPAVSQPPQSGVQVSSVSLGSFPIAPVPPFFLPLGPIVFNVPPNAVSVDVVGVARYTPATIRVPQDFATIQLAVDNARYGDTIRVAAGRWCGALIYRSLNLVGEDGATIMGCPPGNPGPFGTSRRRGFRITAGGAGTSIRNFVFDGIGVSFGGNPLYFGIETVGGADNLVIESNTFQGMAFPILISGGKNQQVTHNVFDGFTILSNGDGGVAILMYDFSQPLKANNSILYNQITSAVPAGDFSWASWTNEVDVPLAGIVVSGQNGTIISNNKISITANKNGDAGVGILATDSVSGFTTINLTITNNDGRGSAYDLIITNDQNGGTGNSVGAQIRGNFGVNLINGATATVRSRSIRTSLLCDPVTGACP